MTNPTPHGQVPEALRLAHIFDNPLPPEWPDMVAAAAELRRQHARIAELEAQIKALSGAQALSAAPAEQEEAAQRLRKTLDIDPGDVNDPLHPRYIAGFKSGHAAGRRRAAPAASPTPPAEQQGAADGFFLLLPQRPKPEAPAGTAGLDWDAYSGAQMLAFGRDCSDAANAALRTQQPAPATQQAGDVVAYLDIGEILAASPTPPAEQQAAQVIIDFSQVGTAGPFPVANGRVSLPDATMQDLARMLRPTYEAEQQAAPKAAPGEPPGIQALMCVISSLHSLRDTAHFSDEEGGELMSALCALRDWAYAQPAPATQQAWATKEHVRLVRVIADKIEDGTLFRSGIYSNKDLARFVRNVADAAAPQFPTTQADSVQEDAARWHWMAGYIVGTRTDLDDELIACQTVDELRKLVDADLAAAQAAHIEKLQAKLTKTPSFAPQRVREG